MSELIVIEDPAAKVGEMLIDAAAHGGAIMLTGGSTPRRSYELASVADWSATTVWFGDERCVPPDDERSNYGMAKAALFDRLERPPDAVQRIAGELEPEAAAERYDAALTSIEGFELILLGVGSDGHAASLFPGRPEIDCKDRLSVAVPEAGLEPFVPRVTLTVPALSRTDQMVFLAAGADKADAIARSFTDIRERRTPAAVVADAAERAGAAVSVIVDQAAGAGLS